MSDKMQFPTYNKLQRNFIKNGYVITEIEDLKNLDFLKKYVKKQTNLIIETKTTLKDFHKKIELNEINNIRMTLANKINKNSWVRPLFYNLGKKKLSDLVGNELSMQNKAILSIQMPQDESSVLPMHCDVFAGESPFQINQWVPLVDSKKSMSMFFLPKKYSLQVLSNFEKYRKIGFQEIFKKFKDKFIWLDVPYGKQVFFCSNFFHGNTINNEDSTRWSFNIRYVNLLKSLVSEEKSIFNFYKPVSLKPSTELAVQFNQIEFKELNTSLKFKKVKKEKITQLQTYVSSRKFGEWKLPVPMQNIVMKDYCDKNNYIFNVSMNELNISCSLTILNTILKNLKNDQGILMCSYKMLSPNTNEVVKLLRTGLENGIEWHFVFENIQIKDVSSLDEFLNLISLNKETRIIQI